jgi:hypothetical protein
MPDLRLASLDDVPALRALMEVSVRTLSAGYYSDDEIASSLRWVFGPDTQLIVDGTYYVIEADGALVAAGGWSRRATLYGGDQMKDDADALLDPGRSPARIRAFFVHPAWARQGWRAGCTRCAPPRRRRPDSASSSSSPPCPASRYTAPSASRQWGSSGMRCQTGGDFE